MKHDGYAGPTIMVDHYCPLVRITYPFGFGKKIVRRVGTKGAHLSVWGDIVEPFFTGQAICKSGFPDMAAERGLGFHCSLAIPSNRKAFDSRSFLDCLSEHVLGKKIH